MAVWNRASGASGLTDMSGGLRLLLSMWAAAEGHATVVRALIEAGAATNATLKSGFTPLFFAVREGHIDVVRVVLEAGVNVNESLKPREDRPAPPGGLSSPPVKNGPSPLLMAVENGHFELAIALVEAGADPNVWKKPDTEGRTPLFIDEGYKAGRPQPSRPTIDAIRCLMAAAGVSTDGIRPRIRDIYEKAPVAPEKPQKPQGSDG